MKRTEPHTIRLQVQGLPGYSTMTNGRNYRNITIQDVIDSSVGCHEKFGNGRLDGANAAAMSDVLEKLHDPNFNPATFPRVFSIAVYDDPLGNAISSIGTRKSRNYPCVSDHDFYNAANMRMVSKYGDFCEDKNKCQGDGSGIYFTACRKWADHEAV